MKSKLDLPFTQQQRGQPHLWFCQAGWRIPDLRIRRNARSFITLWHNGETTCFKKNIRPPKSCFPEKWSWYILISTLVHLICFERSTESIRMFQSTWMTECFGSLACFATWNDVETPTLETFATYVAWSKEGARKGARWATVSHGEPRWAVDSTARRWQARQSAAPTLLAPLAPGIALRLPNCAWVSWIGQRWAAMLWCCELVKPCKTSLRF